MHVPDAEVQSNREMAIMVRRHEKDLYHGNGKPAITVRIEKVEEAIKQIIEAREKSDAKQNKIELLVWGALISGIANLVFSHLKF
jgi:hypothetical protein